MGENEPDFLEVKEMPGQVRIPMKVVSDFDLIPVTGSEVKPIIFGAKRRWRPYRA